MIFKIMDKSSEFNGRKFVLVKLILIIAKEYGIWYCFQHTLSPAYVCSGTEGSLYKKNFLSLFNLFQIF
jgi:hypothetical protein